MKIDIPKSWCENMAKLEDGGEIGAGLLARDVVYRASIRDRMIDDMRRALVDLSEWRKVAKQQGFSRGAKGAEDHAAKALKRFHETWAQL